MDPTPDPADRSRQTNGSISENPSPQTSGESVPVEPAPQPEQPTDAAAPDQSRDREGAVSVPDGAPADLHGKPPQPQQDSSPAKPSPAELAAPDQSRDREGAPGTPDGAPADSPAKPLRPRQDKPPAKPSPAELAASIAVDEDVSLDKELEEAMTGITDADLSATTNAPATSDASVVDQIVKGRVANVGSQDILIDLGMKMLGVMTRSELDKGQTFDIGDEVEVLVTGEDKVGGLLNVSAKKARQEKIFRDMKVGMVLEGAITGMNRGGLEMAIEGLRGFIPASQVELHFVKDISGLIGQTVTAEVTKFDLEDRNIVLSRRKVLAREEAIHRKAAFEELQEGEVKRGKVRSVVDYGAFIDIGGVDGLLHISDMSWGRVKKTEEILKVDDEVDVKILKINREKKKISLGLKQTVPNPWSAAGAKYPNGAKVSGRVVRLANFGAFVELEPGLDALLPISEMSWTRRLRSPKEMVKEGDVVEASVLSCDPENQRISLSLKALAEDPWSAVAQRYATGTTVKGKVVRTTDFGAFVNLEEGIDALIHISELAEEHVRAVKDVVKEGQEVEARVLSVDSEGKKIGLTLKPAPTPPSAEELAAVAAERAAVEKRRNKKRRGGITFGWDEGLSALDPSKFSQ